MKGKTGKRVLYILFAAYLAGAIYFLFVKRNPMAIHENYWQNVRDNINLVLFDTLKLLIRLIDGAYSSYLIRFAVLNIVGNILLFVPLGLFLPSMWRRQRNFWVFSLTCLALVLAVEIAQVFTLLGIGDIDDVILNVSGALMGFGIWKIKPVNKLLGKLGLILP